MNSTPERTDPRRGTQGPSDPRGGILGWFAAHPKTTIALVLALLLCVAAWLIDAVVETRLQRRIDAIRATGAPVSVDDLNAATSVIPDDENMALPILEACAEISAFKIPDDRSSLLPLIGMAYPPKTTGQHVPEDQLDAVRWYLDGIAEPLAKVHEALEMECGCITITWSSPVLSMTWWGRFSEFRHISKILALEALLAAEEGDAQRAGDNLLDAMHFDSVLDCQTTLLAALVQMATQAMAMDNVERTVNLCGLDEPVLRRLQDAFRRTEDQPSIRDVLLTERVIFIDMMEWARSGSGGGMVTVTGPPGSPAAFLQSLWSYVPAVPELDESNGLDVFNAIIEAVDAPDVETLKRAKAAQGGAATLPWYAAISRMTIPSFSTFVGLWIRGVADSRALRAGLACERHRLATGAWPETLDDLVPRYLEAVPIDPFDGKPIRYAHIEEGIKVWSIGEDLADGNGDVQRLARQGNARPGDRGWVLLNPDLRGQPAETDDE